MTTFQAERFDVVHSAACRISAEIDAMLGDLPGDVNLDEVAADLVAVVTSMSTRPDFIRIFTEAIAARQALIELRIKI
jgi:hypothetical protein